MPRIRFLANPDMSLEQIAARLEVLGPEVTFRKTPGDIYGFDAFFPTREAALAAFDDCFEHFGDERPEEFIDNPDLEKVALLP